MGSISVEETELLSDSKYRGYMNQIDRCLRGFESTSEWADLIAALSKLNKVLLGHMKYPIIPRRILISKRLAQCMHPALPAGVHQKALETYDIIFKCMGTNRLAMELFIYSAGLFPLLCNAALNVRSILLSIYETHFVPLGARLRPALNGFLSGVLPGLEEGSEHYQKTNNLLESVAEAVDPQVFYSALWECVATNSTIRLPALTFVLAHCGKKSRSGGGTTSLAPHMLGADHDVMCRALCLALQDSSVLVQRSALDLLLQGFPLHQPQFVWGDMVSLMASVLKSLLRRDMSLNRRLFNWLHGLEVSPPKSREDTADNTKSYFCEHGKELVVLALRRIMEDTINSRMDGSQDTFDTKPYRVLSALLDKPEVGPHISEDIVIDIFRLLYFMSDKSCIDTDGDVRSRPVPQELIKTANLLFSQLETGYVWSACERHFGSACAVSATRDKSAGGCVLDRSLSDMTGSSVHSIGYVGTDMQEMCALIDLLLSIVSIETYAEASLENLPRLFRSMVTSVSHHINSLTGADLEHALRAVKRVLERIMSAVNVWEGGGSGRSVEELDSSLEEPLEATEFVPKSPGQQKADHGDHRTRIHHPRGLISGCVPAYTDMFLSLVRQRILETPADKWHSVLTARIQSTDSALPEESASLTGILNRFMKGKDLTLNGRCCSGTVERARLRDVNQEFVEAFSVACTGLLELSAMPKLGGDEMRARQISDSSASAADRKDLPTWLQAILMCATVTLHQRDSRQERGLKIQLTAISTLLDLANLTATCQASGGDRSNEQHTVSVTMPLNPLLRDQHLRIITSDTDVVCHVAQSLWSYLETAPSNFHPQCIPLLHRLLELAPDAASVEKVLAGSLAAPSSFDTSSSADSSVSVYKRFAQFWHLSRDLNTPRQRTMDLCLLKMMSGLCARASSVRVVCEVWVEHALMRGDTGRLLETLLLALLDPSTARLSVLHWNPRENNNTYIPTKSIKVSTYVEEESGSSGGFPFSVLGEGLINPFALVNSESEFNSDPSGDPSNQSLRLTPLTRSESGSSLYLSNMAAAGGQEESSTCSSLDSTVRKRHSSSLAPEVAGCEVDEASNIVAHILDSIMQRVVSQETYFLRLDDLSFPSARDSSSDGLERDDFPHDHDEDGGEDDDEGNGGQARGEAARPASQGKERRRGEEDSVHPLHSHILLYSNPIDSRSLLHFIKALSNILSIQPRLAVSSLASTGVASPSLTRCVQLIQLLARHKRSILGKGFSASVSAESIAGYRSAMLLEVVLTINLYFVRSFYPRLTGLAREEILGNRELQLASTHLINQIITELILLVNESGKPFALFLVDIFRRIKLQKVILHTVLSLVHSVPKQHLVTTQILRMNMGGTESSSTSSFNSDAFQVQLLKLVVSLVMLEEVVFQKKYEDSERAGQPPAVSTVMKYHPEFTFAEQPMLLAAVLSALRQPQVRELHAQWTNLVISCLPFFGSSLTRVVTSVCGQIWANLELIAQQAMHTRSADYSQQSADLEDRVTSSSEQNGGGEENVPALSDYVLMQLEALGHILSYCLLDTGQAGGVLTPTPQSSIHSTVASFVQALDSSKTRKSAAGKDHVSAARQSLLSMTPRLVVALTALWNAASSTRDSSVVWLAGTRGKAVKSMILELLSPLAKVHPTHFLAAVSIARWEQTESGGGIGGGVTLVQLVSSLKMFPMTTVINTLRQVVKSPPPVSGSLGTRLEVYTMEFLSAYLSSLNSSVLAEAWPSLKDLLKDCLSLKPASVFLALEILHQSVTRGILTNMDKKEVREVQEMAGKLIETVAGIAGSMLEAATWLRGTRTVKSQIEGDRTEKTSLQQVQTAARALNLLGNMMINVLDIIYTSEEKEKVLPLLTTVMYNTVPYLRNHTSTGMSLLQGASRVLASVSEYPYTRRCWRKDGLDLLLDPAFFCMDYESLKSWRVTTDNLMTHDKTTFKDLLTRIAGLGQSNMSIFSSKELEQEQRALLLKRLAFVIFCSDVDQHQKHMPDITDRLSECLRSVPVSPSVLASVFLCFRVVLIRMSAPHVAFLWPVIITEMVVIFSTMENLITAQISNTRKGSGSDLTSINNTASSLGLEASDSPAWLSVYLAVCKLLDQVVLLPSSQLPQFQMYKWAFIREGSSTATSSDTALTSTSPSSSLDSTMTTGSLQRSKNMGKGSGSGGKGARTPSSSIPPLQVHDFVPHIVRIHKLIQTKIGREIPPCPIPVGEPILTMKTIDSLTDLGAWFSAFSNSLTRQQTKTLHNISIVSRSPISFLEKIIEQDFLEAYT